MKIERVEKFNNEALNQGSAILKMKYYNPPNLIVQHVPIKEKVEKLKLIVCVMDIL